MSSEAAAREKHGFDLWAWVVMPEHVHLLIYPKLPGYRIDKILASIKRPVARNAIPQRHVRRLARCLGLRYDRRLRPRRRA
ncbi:MAG: hypothetical protein GXY83_27080 [Rhodopirellula sp.]|nr:hypothetical protein [Rhodopirellula sp.]